MTVELHESAYEAHREAVAMIHKAREWVQDFTTYENGVPTEQTIIERKNKVDEMERSYFSNVAFLLLGAPMFGDEVPLCVSRDGEGCFYWQYLDRSRPKGQQLRYNGGLIFHASYANKGTERLPVGTWSIHT